MATRSEMWERLGGTVDVLVIGGGINGAGIARDAARRGLKVAVVEMNDLASGTSSRSSKLVHGGLRYLEHYEFSLVFEAVSERRILLDIAPHLVNPLGFLFPVYQGDRRSLTTIGAGMMLYDGLSLFRSPKRHRKLSSKKVAAEFPALRQEGLKGAQLYYDCSTDDARLTLETALQAVEVGAVVCSYAKCVELKKEDGRIVSATIEDTFTGERKVVSAGVYVNATGPWTDSILEQAETPADQPLLRPTKGIHIAVAHSKLPIAHAVVHFHPGDGRILFSIPWGDLTYVGTTDTDWDGDLDSVYADRADVDYLLECMTHYYPEHPLDDDDVISTWAGLRPLVRPEAKPGVEMDESSVSREHRIVVGEDGLVTIAGGKLTTYRLMSKEVVDTAVKVLRLSGKLEGRLRDPRTDDDPLPGAVNWPADDDHDAVARSVKDVAGQAVSDETAALLASTYGMLSTRLARRVRKHPELAAPLVPGRPEILAQVQWGVEQELCATVTDALKQRTQLFYRDTDQGLGAIEATGQLMQTLLGWTDEQRQASEQDYRDEVAKSRAWQHQPRPESASQTMEAAPDVEAPLASLADAQG